MPLWHKDYLELKAIRKQAWNKSSPFCIKTGHTLLFAKVTASFVKRSVSLISRRKQLLIARVDS